MRIVFSDHAWDDYLYWQIEDKKIIKKINELIKSIERTPFEGIGKPEPLKFALSGMWSRRIDIEHRLIYQINGNDLYIHSCRYHFDD